jgi:hypothetical protein
MKLLLKQQHGFKYIVRTKLRQGVF